MVSTFIRIVMVRNNCTRSASGSFPDNFQTIVMNLSMHRSQNTAIMTIQLRQLFEISRTGSLIYFFERTKSFLSNLSKTSVRSSKTATLVIFKKSGVNIILRLEFWVHQTAKWLLNIPSMGRIRFSLLISKELIE